MAKSLSDYREDHFLTVDEFVERLGISLNTYYRILEGNRPRPTTIRRIAERLGVTPNDITEFARRKPQEGTAAGGASV